MERLSTLIEIANWKRKACDQIAQAGYAVILANIVAANTGIVPTPDHMRTAKTSFKTATQAIQNKLQKPRILNA